MKRARFQHQAHVLSHMFRGWQLHSDYRVLTELGTGTLHIDVLSESCQHNDVSIPPLTIARVLRLWLEQDLKDNRGSLADVREARVVANLEVEEHEGQRDSSKSWARSSGIFVSCRVNVRSKLATQDRVYEAKYSDELEWPRDWAA